MSRLTVSMQDMQGIFGLGHNSLDMQLEGYILPNILCCRGTTFQDYEILDTILEKGTRKKKEM